VSILEHYGASFRPNQNAKSRLHLGEYVKALRYHEQALAIHRATSDRAGEVASLANIDVVYWSLDQNTKALSYFEQALAIHRELGDQASIPADLLETANVAIEQGRVSGYFFRAPAPLPKHRHAVIFARRP